MNTAIPSRPRPGGEKSVSLVYSQHNRILLKNHPNYSERWLQERIISQPSILGLGDVELKDVERIQPSAGRLDLLLTDPETETRYEVELQLGGTNETHIIRTIEYWDIERRRYPQYDHVGVIVAEEITARFFNVISLFNGFIPLIAIQLYAVELEGKITLVFTKVLDRINLGLEEEEASDAITDRNYWEKKSAPPMLQLMDEIFGIVREVVPGVTLNYRKRHVGLIEDGTPSNFVNFRPLKGKVATAFKLPRTDELTQRLEEAGIEATYTRAGRYRLRLTEATFVENKALIRELATLAREGPGSQTA